jgi:hypothetical protein
LDDLLLDNSQELKSCQLSDLRRDDALQEILLHIAGFRGLVTKRKKKEKRQTRHAQPDERSQMTNFTGNRSSEMHVCQIAAVDQISMAEGSVSMGQVFGFSHFRDILALTPHDCRRIIGTK